jgi:hypothetical protein
MFFHNVFIETTVPSGVRNYGLVRIALAFTNDFEITGGGGWRVRLVGCHDE